MLYLASLLSQLAKPMKFISLNDIHTFYKYRCLAGWYAGFIQASRNVICLNSISEVICHYDSYFNKHTCRQPWCKQFLPIANTEAYAAILDFSDRKQLARHETSDIFRALLGLYKSHKCLGVNVDHFQQMSEPILC